MLSLFKNFLKEEDGMSTVEIVIIIAVLVGLAILFRGYIVSFVKDILEKVFQSDQIESPYPSSTP
ncbi:Flp1 family type IVb pilin [Acetivibrio cellulolyticus]|uniref:Flp1 family type IVb pilin n=1 Tax=Acetivibrio cellulolyticus TaxID=35830 RepID=UPI0001E2D09B|nr:Flp1 family type IVb pilin [Acetivibrio cellulolyticus]